MPAGPEVSGCGEEDRPDARRHGRVRPEAAEAGVTRAGLQTRSVAGVALQAIMFNAFAATISGSSIRPDGHEAAEEFWDLFIHGIATP